MRRSAIAFAPVLVAVLAAAACSSSSSKSSTTSTLAAQPAAATSPPTTKLTLPPYQLGSVLDLIDTTTPQADAKAAAQAAADDINASGGINGHPVEVSDICDDKLDANSTEQCGRQIAGDPSILATVGDFANFGDSADAIFQAQGVPVISDMPISQGEATTCTVCFATGGGAVGGLGGASTLISDVIGQKPFSFAIADVPAGRSAPAIIGVILKGRGSSAKIARTIFIPIAQSDFSAIVANATSGNPEAIQMAASTAQTIAFAEALHNSGTSVPLVATTFQLTPPDITKLGAAAEGMYIAGFFALTGPGPDKFTATMTKINPAYTSAEAANMWIGVHLFADVAKTLPEGQVTRANVLAALKADSHVDTDGFTPVLDFSKPGTALGGALPRLFNTTVIYARVQGGKIVEIDAKFHDVFTTNTQ